jgi:hypothetical protein
MGRPLAHGVYERTVRAHKAGRKRFDTVNGQGVRSRPAVRRMATIHCGAAVL